MSKKIVQEYLKKGDKINAKVVFDNGKTFKIEVEGVIKSMSNSNSGGFSNKQLEQLTYLMSQQLKPIVERLDQMDQRLDKVDERLDKVDKRLDIIEKDIKLMKNTPTMQRELSNKYNN